MSNLGHRFCRFSEAISGFKCSFRFNVGCFLFQQLKPKMASNLKLFLASRFRIYEVFLFRSMPAICEYLPQTW